MFWKAQLNSLKNRDELWENLFYFHMMTLDLNSFDSLMLTTLDATFCIYFLHYVGEVG